MHPVDVMSSWRSRSPAVFAALPWLVDAVVLGLLALIVAGDDTAPLFQVVYFLLVLASFLWDLEGFTARSSFWCGVTSVVLGTSVITGRAPAINLVDVVFFAGVLLLVYRVRARRRDAMLEVERLLEEQHAQVVRLQDLAELKADFTAMVVHEFGNPLAALRRLNEMMQFDGLDAEAKAFVIESTRVELGVLETLVADVSATVVVEREDFRVEPHPVALAALLDQAETYGRSVCARQVFSVEADDAVRGSLVRADGDRIGQVIRNLVSNAAKYSPAGGRVTLKVASPRPGIVRFEVADEGRGISPADLERVFDKFGRGRPSGSSRVPGVGLGLYICGRLISSHGSELTVTSKPGSGSVFGFELELVDQ